MGTFDYRGKTIALNNALNDIKAIRREMGFEEDEPTLDKEENDD